MKTFKIIDLLNKIVNGEEAPRLIRINGFNFRFISYVSVDCFYTEEETSKYWFDFMSIDLNDVVEILDKEDEFEDIESFGVHYSWDYIDYKNIEELKKYVNKDFQNIFDTLDKLIKNQKKIIERLNNLDNN